MTHTLNEIIDHPPSAVGVNNENEGIMHEPGLNYFIQIQYDGDDHGKGDDI